jgi:isopenicillin-N epimerase
MREHFLLNPGIRFLNHGSFGACPREVFEDFQRWQREMEANPVEFLGRRSGGLLQHARAALAEMLGAHADDLAFVPNATTGVNTVARSLRLGPGDEVLATDHEYGACDATWRFACAQVGAQYRRVPLLLPFDAGSVVQRMMDAVTPRTRVIFASHITSTTALTLPVAGLCAAARERGITTLIDGAHAPGQLTLDLGAVGADFYTGNCHKWLCAPKGAAFLHVRPERQAEIDAPVVSWGYVAAEEGGHTGFDAYTGRSLLERRLQWQGTRDIAAFLAVPSAIDFQRRHGWDRWRARCHELACATRARVLAASGLPLPSADADHAQMIIIPVALPSGWKAETLHRWLREAHRIEVPVTKHDSHTFVRLSVQAYNTQAELDALAQALAAL